MWSRVLGGLKPADYDRRPAVRVALAMIFCFAGSTALTACPICFQMDDSATKAGVRAAVAVLGLVTVSVLGCVGVLARRIARHEAARRE